MKGTVNAKTLKIEDNGWSEIWIAEYANGGTRIVERFTGDGWDENLKRARRRLAEMTVEKDGASVGVSKYSISELWAVLPEDRWVVRDEAMRRHDRAVRRLAKIKSEVAALESLVVAALKAQ